AGVRAAEALASATVSLRSCHNHKYPRSVAEFDKIENLCWTSLFEGFAPKQPLLTSRARVVTLGSCFAVNIAERLARCGVSAFTGRVHEEANSPIAIRDLFAFLLAPHLCRYPDLWAPEIPQSRIQKFREFYAAADCAVLTVGVGIACENWLTGELVLRPNSRTAKDCVWRLVGREEAASAIGDAVQILRRSKPGIPVVVTVSPVPLFRSFLTPSSFVDDCLSKSVLRTAVQDALSASPPGVYYWPTFEMFRWVGSHTPPVFGADDGLPRHPNNALVDIAARAFARAFVSQVSESVAEGGEVELLDLVSDIPERKRAGGAPEPGPAKGETSAPGNAPKQPRAG
ncbi:MAG: GSCFA domain-containing protein, partial [Terrimicrobiaceae bacterium]|nr:GSCFA domain-containing protein [Terrimicrobiaceae bacterium]